MTPNDTVANSFDNMTVVILAAGEGTRLSHFSSKTKVLLGIYGKSIIEWSILTFKKAGIHNFKVVVNNRSEDLNAHLNDIKKKYSIEITSIVCADAALGNGVSLACGLSGLNGSAVIAMADHIFSLESLVSFLDSLKNNQSEPALACDSKIDQIFDIDDATKVQVKDSKITKIGKHIDDYQLIDMGLFYFPQQTHSLISELAQKGCHSISDIVKNYITNRTFKALVIPEAHWQDVDTTDMLEQAKEMIKSTKLAEG